MKRNRCPGNPVWRWWRALGVSVFLLTASLSAQTTEEAEISASQRTTISAVVDQALTTKVFDDKFLPETVKIIASAAELENRSQLEKLEALVAPWLPERVKGIEQLVRCMKQECLPSDVWRETRQAALLLTLINNIESRAIEDFGREHASALISILTQLLVTEGKFKLPMLLRLQILSDLVEFADNHSDSELAHAASEQMIKLMPSIAGSVRGRGFGEKSYASEIFNSQIAALHIYILFYQSTAERSWLERAQQIARILSAELLEPTGGSVQAKKEHINDAVTLAPLLLTVHHYTGNDEYREAAEGILRQVAPGGQSLGAGTAADLLRTANRLSNQPLHITIVGRKLDPDALLLFNAARKIKSSYKRLEWWDEGEGKMPNPDVRFPSLKRSAAFVCAEKRCSMPIFEPQDIERRITEFRASKSAP